MFTCNLPLPAFAPFPLSFRIRECSTQQLHATAQAWGVCGVVCEHPTAVGGKRRSGDPGGVCGVSPPLIALGYLNNPCNNEKYLLVQGIHQIECSRNHPYMYHSINKAFLLQYWMFLVVFYIFDVSPH